MLVNAVFISVSTVVLLGDAQGQCWQLKMCDGETEVIILGY